MCKNCYEKYIKRSEKTMLICKLKEFKHSVDEIACLCICQRYCNDKDKYIPFHQKNRCKYYE